MTMQLQAITGISIQGMATAWPEDLLGPSARKSDDDVYAQVLGKEWQTILQQKNWDTARTRTTLGVSHRSWTRGTTVGSVDLSITAAEKALADAGINAADVDCIVAATCTPDHITSTVAGKVAKHLKTSAAAIDIRAGGAGGLNAMSTAALYHRAGCKISLVVAAEVSSKYLGEHDLSNALLFGDGAAAFVLVSAADAGGLIGAVSGNSDWQGTAFTVPGILPPAKDSNAADFQFQKPDTVYREHLNNNWVLAAETLRSTFPDATGKLSAVLPYAVTPAQIEQCANSFSTRSDASLALLKEHGCIGCASPLAAMVSHWQQHDTPGETIASLAVAGGISWAGILWQR